MSSFANATFEDTLPGFEHILRYYDPRQGQVLAKILPGEFYLTSSAREAIVTTLGSCVAACIRDPEARLGGMNHFMLPGEPKSSGPKTSLAVADNCYGAIAMQSLVSKLLKHGGCRDRLEIKLTGGGRIGSGPGTVGDSNIQFITDFLALEGFRAVSADLGGSRPRKVHYEPRSGTLLVKKLACLHSVGDLAQERRYRDSIRQQPHLQATRLF